MPLWVPALALLVDMTRELSVILSKYSDRREITRGSFAPFAEIVGESLARLYHVGRRPRRRARNERVKSTTPANPNRDPNPRTARATAKSSIGGVIVRRRALAMELHLHRHRAHRHDVVGSLGRNDRRSSRCNVMIARRVGKYEPYLALYHSQQPPRSRFCAMIVAQRIRQCPFVEHRRLGIRFWHQDAFFAERASRLRRSSSIPVSRRLPMRAAASRNRSRTIELGDKSATVWSQSDCQ